MRGFLRIRLGGATTDRDLKPCLAELSRVLQRQQRCFKSQPQRLVYVMRTPLAFPSPLCRTVWFRASLNSQWLDSFGMGERPRIACRAVQDPAGGVGREGNGRGTSLCAKTCDIARPETHQPFRQPHTDKLRKIDRSSGQDFDPAGFGVQALAFKFEFRVHALVMLG